MDYNHFEQLLTQTWKLQSRWIRRRFWFAAAAIVLAAAATLGTAAGELTAWITACLAAIGAAWGYGQWALSRYESSFDKFYDRLQIANNHLIAIISLQSSNLPNQTSGKSQLSPFDMWVYAELDNLEYILEKYSWGFVTTRQTCRAILTFYARCQHDPKFGISAAKHAKSAGYHPSTLTVVTELVRCSSSLVMLPQAA